MPGLSKLNLALTKIVARAEKRDAEVLRDTFVEFVVLEQGIDTSTPGGRLATTAWWRATGAPVR
jgi:hypothetical protein